MDFNALQHKLFAMDPVDPREDLARLKAQAQGSVPSQASESVDYLNESVAVPEGSLKMDRNYSVNDFAALAGVVSEKKQRPADQVRGDEPMPKTSKPSKTGEQEHPLNDRLVGETWKDDRITELERRVEVLEATIMSLNPTPTSRHESKPAKTVIRPKEHKQHSNVDSIKEDLMARLNKLMDE